MVFVQVELTRYAEILCSLFLSSDLDWNQKTHKVSLFFASKNKSFCCEKMEPETRRRIEKTVLEILKSADMDEMTEFKVRKLASDKLGINLSAPDYKRFVRQVVETFLQSTEEPGREPEPEPEPDRKKANTEAAEREPTEEEEEEEVEEDRGKSSGVKEYDDDGDLIICRLSDRRRVTIQDFRGKTLVSIREFYRKDGKELPSSKGISLTAEQWSAFKKNVPAIEEAIQKMESRLM